MTEPHSLHLLTLGVIWGLAGQKWEGAGAVCRELSAQRVAILQLLKAEPALKLSMGGGPGVLPLARGLQLLGFDSLRGT